MRVRRRAAAVLGAAGLGLVTWDAVRVGLAQRRAAALDGLARDHTTTVGEGLGAPLRLVVLGDSAADGFGIADPDDAFPRRLAVGLSVATQRRVHVRSCAVSGARTADLVADQVPLLRAAGADVVVASCGVNDVVHRTPLDRVERDTTALLDGIRHAVPAASVALVGCPDLSAAPGIAWPLSALVRRRCRQVADVQRERARRADVVFVDLVAVPPVRDLFGADGFHPGPEAQWLLARRTVAALSSGS